MVRKENQEDIIKTYYGSGFSHSDPGSGSATLNDKKFVKFIPTKLLEI
jgi:hypothetical protein